MFFKKFVSKFPVLCSFISCLLGFGIFQVCSGLFYLLFFKLNVSDAMSFVYLSLVTLSVLFVVLFCILLRKRFKLKLSFVNNGDPRFLLHLCLIVALLGIPVFINIMEMGFNPSFSAFCISLSAGVSEEFYCRFLPVVILMGSAKMKDNKFLIVLLPALYFSVFHFCNYLFGADLSSTFFQLIYSFGMGVAFGAFFVCTGNILYPVIIHFLFDYFQLCAIGGDGLITSNMAEEMGEYLWVAYVLVSIYSGLFVLISKLMMKKMYYSKIDEVWGNIWFKREVPVAEICCCEQAVSENNFTESEETGKDLI